MVTLGLNTKKYMYYNIIVVPAHGLVYDANTGTMDLTKIYVMVPPPLHAFILITFLQKK